MINTVIFDLDGLLADTEPVWYQVFKNLYQDYGVELTLEQYLETICGQMVVYNIENFVKKYQISESQETLVQRVIDDEARHIANGVGIKPGARELLCYLKEHGYKVVLGSSSKKPRALSILKQHDLDQYFDDFVVAYEVQRSKPFPDVFLKAAEKVGSRPEECLVLEDSEAGIQAAWSGHIPVICIPDQKQPGAEMAAKTAALLPSLYDVMGYLDRYGITAAALPDMKTILKNAEFSETLVSVVNGSVPKAGPGQVLVRVNAFGVNLLDFEERKAGSIPGVECVGEIADASDCSFQKGEPVMVLWNRPNDTFYGTWAEYLSVPSECVYSVHSDLSWKELAAVPISYVSVWCELFEHMDLQKEDCLLVRGAVSAAGYAAIQFAKALGCKVVAATEKASKIPLLEQADAAVLDHGDFDIAKSEATKIIDLRTDDAARRMLKAMPEQETVNHMFAFMKEHEIRPEIERLFDFEDMEEAVSVLKSGKTDGKIVVVHYDDNDEETTNWLNDLADLFGSI